MNRSIRTALALATCTLVGPVLAHAQAQRTWVSGVGDDANPCSRTAPCKTFAGAISKTATGGEISVLDPGGYGSVTIVKSMTIDGDGTLASIVANGTHGITVSGANVAVTLRNLSLVGIAAVGLDLKGVRLLNGATLVIDRVAISGFSTGVSTTTGNATVLNSTIIQNTNFGVQALGGTIAVDNSTLAFNGAAVQAETGATVFLANSAIYYNLTGFGCGGGTLASAGNNRKANNVGGVVASCAPNAVLPLK